MSTITWYGHSAFRLSDDNVSILIDPYFSVPSLEPEVIEDGVDLVLITHDHGDHTGDCVDICKKTHAKLGAIVGTAGALQKKGIPASQILGGTGFNMGGTIAFKGASVTMTQAYHTSDTGSPAGYIIQMPDGLTVYHAGDTCIFSGMALWGKLFRIDVALLPIGGFYTMDFRQAVMACGLLKCSHVIPMHFGTFPVLEKDSSRFAAELKKEMPGCTLLPLESGKSVTFSH